MKTSSSALKDSTSSPPRFWEKKVPLPIVLIIIFIALCLIIWQGFLLSALAQKRHLHFAPKQTTELSPNNQQQNITTSFNSAPISSQAAFFNPLKEEIILWLSRKTAEGIINNASVYVQKLNDGSSFNINGNETYNPGSILKVVSMIAYLKQAEADPSFYNKQLTARNLPAKIPAQTFGGEHINPNGSFTLKELLFHMIVNSDNYATAILHGYLDITVYNRIYSDFGMMVPDIQDIRYSISPVDYSKFFEVLYHEKYLTQENSQFAISLLMQSGFQNGMLNALPGGTKVAHKFGEFGTAYPGAVPQLHESGIIFLDGNPFLITIMTKGNDVRKLPAIISEITRLVFEEFKSNMPES